MTSPDRQPIEIGVLVLDALHADARSILESALDGVRELLVSRFPDFRWEFPAIERNGPPSRDRVDPGALLFEGINERDRQHWDMALVVTASDLHSRYKPYALAVPSRSTGVAVVSLARLTEPGPLHSLIVHVLADLAGVPHSESPDEFTYSPREIAELERMRTLPDAAETRMRGEFTAIADTRLEERAEIARGPVPMFYARATLHGRKQICNAVLEAQPWALPFRLSRLTAAAAAATLLLTMTAEAWDLGSRQPAGVLVLMAGVAAVAAAGFLLHRQKLLVRRSQRLVSEQIVVTNVSIIAVVVLGMAATWAVLALLSALLSALMIDPGIVASWTSLDKDEVGWRQYVSFASFVATTGTVVGALGASFEGHDVVRYAVFADEEV